MLIPLLTGMIPRLTGSTFTNKFDEYCSTLWKANIPITFPSVVPPTRLVGVANVVLPSHVPCEPVAVPGAKYSPPPWAGSVDRRPDQPTKRNQSTKHGNRRINCNQKKTFQAKINTLNFQLARTKQIFNDLISKKQKIVKRFPKDIPPVPGIPLHALGWALNPCLLKLLVPGGGAALPGVHPPRHHDEVKIEVLPHCCGHMPIRLHVHSLQCHVQPKFWRLVACQSDRRTKDSNSSNSRRWSTKNKCYLFNT